jgi:hypothetical protein
MGGVDVGDQAKAYIRPVIRSNRPMRSYQLEKLVHTVNQSRIVYTGLQPARAPVGIKEASERIALELISPYLEAKATSSTRKRKAGDAEMQPEPKYATASDRLHLACIA